MYADAAQKLAAERSIEAARPRFASPIVTELVPAPRFWPAEDYHQDYFTKNPDQGYCQYVVRAKVDKMRNALSGADKH
jgi:peptide-methionine (S)-S-oxide reductase